MLSTHHPSHAITDTALLPVMGGWELTWLNNAEPDERQLSDSQLVKLLKVSGQINGHRTCLGQFSVITDGGLATLQDFITHECDLEKLISKVK